MRRAARVSDKHTAIMPALHDAASKGDLKTCKKLVEEQKKDVNDKVSWQ